VTPRSHRDTVIDSTSSASASCFWVKPTLRRAVRSRPPTPPLPWVPKLRTCNTRPAGPLLYHPDPVSDP
jgi:hypothetical protein